ncbi:methyltransferase family protein [Kineothrix alysoides]|uniref:Methyltransferase family protein n=1 Tax=Kineothrix alysoides TaxID=1469948 RepID=A0A4R1R0X9_9FIRM|nr:class I SAM-dependent methyltransferase [Kineothrix alysoides]TCL58951.1 methyltransferase family protein [Kineothrix alysoides]
MNNKKEKSKTAFNQQAPTYDIDMKGAHARNLYPALLKKLSNIEYHTVLDLGCGTGAIIQAILREAPDKEVYGIDISEKMLQKAKEKLTGKATLTLGDSEHLPYQDSLFDVIYCNDSFHHYPHPEKVLAEAHRVLKPGGTIIIGDCWLPFVSRIIMNVFIRFSNEGDVKIYSEREICDMLNLHFHNVTWQKANHSSYIAAAAK